MQINERIKQFNTERGLLDAGFNKAREGGHIAEELSELLRSSNDSEIVDSICDIIVFASGALLKLGYDIDKSMNETLLEIEDRRGNINKVTGKWEKIPRKLCYKANYGNAKMDFTNIQ